MQAPATDRQRARRNRETAEGAREAETLVEPDQQEVEG